MNRLADDREHAPLDLASRLISIEDPDDPRIAVFRSICERDLIGRSGFIAEGSVVLDQLAVSQRFRATGFLILKGRIDGLRSVFRALRRISRSTSPSGLSSTASPAFRCIAACSPTA